MITCTLRDKKYTVDFISGRALREMEPALKMYSRIIAVTNAVTRGEPAPEDDTVTMTDALDTMVKWFCVVFGNQFTPDEVFDGYPADRLMHDIALTLLAVQAQTTEVLEEFPTKAAPTPTKAAS